MNWIGLEDTAQHIPHCHHCWEKGRRGIQIASVSVHICPQNSCLVLLCPLAQTTPIIQQLTHQRGPKPALRMARIPHSNWDIFRFTLVFFVMMMCCTHCQEEHAVHSKRGVTGVERQSREKKESNLRLYRGYLNCNIQHHQHRCNTEMFSSYLDSVTSGGAPVQLILCMYPMQALGAHTAMKLGLGRPIVNLARSVSDWLTAAPNRQVPTTLQSAATYWLKSEFE